jgi:hypothetical protein
MERGAVGHVDVADEPPHPRRRITPWEDLERGEIRGQQHIRLFHPHESGDGGPVEHDVALQRLPELRAWDLDVLDNAQNVGELQAQKTDLLGFREFEDVRGSRAREIGGHQGTAWRGHAV